MLNRPSIAGDVKIVNRSISKEWKASAALNIVENALTQANNPG